MQIFIKIQKSTQINTTQTFLTIQHLLYHCCIIHVHTLAATTYWSTQSRRVNLAIKTSTSTKLYSNQ